MAQIIFTTILGLLLLTPVLPAVAAGEDMFVSDQLPITVRSGPSSKHRVIGSASSGEVLEILENKGDYAHVRNAKGQQGWVLKKFLQDEPVARKQVTTLQRQVKELQDKLTENEMSCGRQQADSSASLASCRQQVADLQSTIQDAEPKPTSSSDRPSMLLGGGLVLAGLLLGLIVTTLRGARLFGPRS